MSECSILDFKTYYIIVKNVEYYKLRIRMLKDHIDRRIKDLGVKTKYLLGKGEILFIENCIKEIKLLMMLRDILYNLELSLVAILERLDTIRIISQALDGFKPMLEIVSEALSTSQYVSKKFQTLMDSLVRAYIDLISYSELTYPETQVEVLSPEASHILSEIEKELERISVEKVKISRVKVEEEERAGIIASLATEK